MKALRLSVEERENEGSSMFKRKTTRKRKGRNFFVVWLHEKKTDVKEK